MQPHYLDNDSEHEEIEDCKMGGYHAPSIGWFFINFREVMIKRYVLI